MKDDTTYQTFIRYLILIFSSACILLLSIEPYAHGKHHDVSSAAPVNSNKECVVLLHGLARTSSSFKKMENRLKQEGFVIVNNSYPSRSETIEVLSKKHIESSIQECGNVSKIHFVTHSMGGILVRHYIGNHEIDNLGRVVMLGPPNKGSQIVDKLGHFPGFKFLNGPAGMQLGTGALDSSKASLPTSLGKAQFDLGIIAGTKSINLILSTLLPAEDDGKVTVEATKLEGMNEHIVLPVTHTFMMKNEEVIAQVIHYLQQGRFEALDPKLGSQQHVEN